MNIFVQMIAKAIGIADWQVEHTLDLLDGGATIPFISRYRKEATGSLDEVKIAEIKEQSDKLKEIQKRKETVLSTIEEQGKLTDELKKRIENCWNATELEDIYLPFKPKKRTRAEIARQKGLEPLATILLFQNERDIESRAMKFVKGDVESAEDALKGACDIIAEQVSEDEVTRNRVRNHFQREAVITAKVVKGKEEEGQKYRDYFDFSEPLKKCTSHRLLALRRGESEGILRVSISPDDERVDDDLQRKYVRGNNECSKWVGLAVADAYKRLLKPSIENEFASLSKNVADTEAIRIFAR
ncbi:MAG: RNA-binding transcriptional accessory protein, partial [Bacteroidaceae bacterium]|nr:RNA-binding transcriptional accessory protein [Bacteroidaceae bacterium]